MGRDCRSAQAKLQIATSSSKLQTNGKLQDGNLLFVLLRVVWSLELEVEIWSLCESRRNPRQLIVKLRHRLRDDTDLAYNAHEVGVPVPAGHDVLVDVP